MAVRLLVAAIALACALAIPLRLSADVWAYAAYGALVTHGVDPWSHAFRTADVAALHDRLIDRALGIWGGSLPRDVYGALFTLPCAALVSATRGFGPGGTIAVMRGGTAFALLGCIALAERTRPRLAPLLAFHPVALWSAAEGHNDVWWLLLVLIADRARGVGRVALLASAAAVKAIAAIPLLEALAAPGAARRRSTAVALGALALAYAPLAWSLVAHGLDRSTAAPRLSLVHAGALAAWSGSPIPLLAALAIGALGVLAVARALRSWDVTAGAALLGWLLLPAPEPWYALWLLPVVALSGPTPASRGLLAATFTGLTLYAQDAVSGTVLHDPAFLGGTMLALYVVPIVLALLAPAMEPQVAQVPPTPPPLAAASPSPAPTPLPTPTAAPTAPPPLPSPTPTMFSYVVDPAPPPPGAPRIFEVALNDRTLHRGGMLLVKVTTSPEVTSMVARTLGQQIGIPLASPGVFAGMQQLPSGIPFWLLGRDYTIDFVGTTADGRTAMATLPMRLDR